MKLQGLSRQIVLSMSKMALGVTLLTFIGSYLFYYVAMRFWPASFGSEDLALTPLDWAWMLVTTLCAVLLATIVAVRLAQRILLPLNSVADCILRVAAGDLGVRALPGDRTLREAADLADNFNVLVDKLQKVTEEQVFWNAAIAHELRTPVTILRGRLQGLAEGVFVPSEAQFASLLKHVEGLGRLIEDLRVVSLAESGRVDLQWQMSRLDVEAGNVVRLFERALLDAGLRPSLATTPGEVPCDPLRIRQALLALLENARVHAVPGELRIGVCIADGWARVYVEDEGPGVAESDRSEIFTAFRRAAAPGASGAGLGLAVVAAIAAAHGGRAACVAADTGGSRFELAWPIPNGGEDAGALAAVARSAQ